MTLALALVSAACSGSTRGGGDAAPVLPSTTSAPGSSLGTIPTDTAPSAASSPGSKPTAATGTRPGASGPARLAGEPNTTTSTLTTSHPSVTTTTDVTVPPGLPPAKCPEPKTCRRHAFLTDASLYPAGADGRVTLEYWLNPTGLDTSTMTVHEAEGGLAAAFDTWARAAPALRFVYRGRTTRGAVPGDGFNVVSFQGATAYTNYQGREFDMEFTPTNWMWAPCEQRDGACTRVERRNPVGNNDLNEFQSVVTHEAGHALGLAHVDDPELDRWMTMAGFGDGGFDGNRFLATLALGEVLGIRALYPCSCPLPPIYDP